MAPMTRFRNRISLRDPLRFAGRLAADRRGATAVEYGLILALIFMTMIGAVMGVADVTVNMWGNISAKVQNAR